MLFLKKFLTVIAVLVVLLFSVELFFISLTEGTNLWILQLIEATTKHLYQDPNLRMVTLGLSGLFLLTCISFIPSLIFFNRREKTISLTTPYGEVQVALGAIEDFVKIAKDHVPGVHELRPKIFVRGHGLKIYVRAALWSDQSIPSAAQDIQDTIRQYIQNTLGIDQPVEIRVFVSKIMYRESSNTPTSPTPRPIQYQEFRQ